MIMERYLNYGAHLIALLLLLSVPGIAGADWVSGGVPVSTGSGNRNPEITTDGARGAIIAWCDAARTYVQRVGFTGDVKWVPGGILLGSSGTDPQIVSDGAGGAVIAWLDTRNGDIDIYAQRIDSSGVTLWTGGGVPICSADGGQKSFRMIGDGSGGTIITWEDGREEEVHIYAQKVGGDGNTLWAADGIRVDTGIESACAPDIDTDGAGGAYLTWAVIDSLTNELLDREILVARVNADGSHAWDPPVITCATGSCSAAYEVREWWFPRLTRDGYGGTIVAWADPWNEEYDLWCCAVYVQKVDAGGEVCWPDSGINIGGYYANSIQLAPDGMGGAFLTWHDWNNLWLIQALIAQRIDGEGSKVWDSPVFLLNAYRAWGYSAVMSRRYHMTLGEIGRVYVAFERGLYLDEDMETRFDIYANRLNRDGGMWTVDGLPVCTVAGDQTNPRIVSAGDGSSITVWEDPRGEGSIYAQLLNAWGVPPVATLLESCAAGFDGERVVIEWILSEADDDLRFFILRAEGEDGMFGEIPSPAIEQDGLKFTFVDNACEPGTVYRYRVEVEDVTGRLLLFESDPVTIPPMPLTLSQNYPNPFNPVTTIRYYLPEPGRVRLGIYDSAGRRIVALVDGHQERGGHEIEWDGTDAGGRLVGSGVYLVRLEASKRTISSKMVLIR